MTVPVSVQQRIRVLDAHGVSWRSIAKEVGVARDTVAKYAGREDCSPKPEHSASRPSKLDPFKATVDGWLEADRFMPRKQRHTAKRVYDRLVSERGYGGAYSSVQRYVKLGARSIGSRRTGIWSSSGIRARRRSISAWRGPWSAGTGSTCIAWS